MSPKVGLTKGGPGTRKLEAQLAALQRMEVLVGVPENKAPRRNEPINNAQLIYIHTHGSPIRNIPPRPIIEPALAHDRVAITDQLKQANQAVLEDNTAQALAHLQAAGIEGRNACIRWFDNPLNGWPPNAPSTIRAKGSSHPLIDTGQLRRSITYVVVEK